MKQVEILIPTALDHGFDYLVPEGMALNAGDIVSVPFGRGESLGVAWDEGKAKLAPAKLKPVALRHDFPPLSDAMRQFIDWAAWYNCAPKGAILKMVLPVAEIDKEGRVHLDTAIHTENLHLAKLSDVQKSAALSLEGHIGNGFSVALLDGVTGSGKTEVYFDAIAKALSLQSPVASRQQTPSSEDRRQETGDSQVLILLPEIALSVQWLERFEKRFGFKPVIWNSEITPARKRAGWQAIARGEARVVVGARSALFLPYKKLSLIIADEEHDQSYKQEDGVVYHARDMAVARARFEKLPVILVSATPSLESYHNAQGGKYREVSLPARHNAASMPAVEMLDMRQVEVERGAFISRPLRDQLARSVADGHQAMLFLNRRGYAPLVLCRTCGHRFQCPQCSSWMVLHKKKTNYLQCHHCDCRTPLPDTCPACTAKESFAACGPGVDRIMEEVTSFLPQARVAVMASDSDGGFKEISETITAMSEKRIDILIGTQMIAKGHHFSDLAVVGVIDADLGLAGGDLRASERTYQLLHQLSGRAGREQVSGRVYLQSYLPDHPVMQALLSGDRNTFLQAELQARKNAHMPPFSRLAAVIIDGEKEEQVMKTAQKLAQSAARSPGIQILGPAPAPLYMLRNRFRFRLLVKAERSINLPDYMKHWIDAQDHPSSVRVKIDMDPMSFL